MLIDYSLNIHMQARIHLFIVYLIRLSISKRKPLPSRRKKDTSQLISTLYMHFNDQVYIVSYTSVKNKCNIHSHFIVSGAFFCSLLSSSFLSLILFLSISLSLSMECIFVLHSMIASISNFSSVKSFDSDCNFKVYNGNYNFCEVFFFRFVRSLLCSTCIYFAWLNVKCVYK